MRRLFSGRRLMSHRFWRIGIRPTGSRCREQRSGRSIRPGDPTADAMFSFACGRFHRKLVDRLGKKGLLPAISLRGGQLDASADESEEIHMEPPAHMDDIFLPAVSDTAAVEFPVVDGLWTPTVKVADGVLFRLVSPYRHLGTQASHGARRGLELAARRSRWG